MSSQIHRRQFIRDTTAAFALTALKTHGMNIDNIAANRRVALIGTGWYGKSDLFRLIQVAPVEVVALCDADTHQLESAADLVSQRGQQNRKRPALYGDYRKLLSEQKPDIVLVGTPDHWHALITIEAIKSGAHVYAQKPISVDVVDGVAR